MRILATRSLLVGVLASGCWFVTGCSANIHDNTVNVDAKLAFKADVDVESLKPGDSVAVTMDATGVVLVPPEKEPPPADADHAAYFKIFLDDEDSSPLVVTAQTSVQVKIPPSTPKGHHRLICRLHKHDGQPTNQSQEIDINVSASVTVQSGAHDAGAAPAPAPDAG